MKIDIRQFLFDRGFVQCDKCVGWIMLPRWLAMERGWHCGGELGHYDYCPSCVKKIQRSTLPYEGKAYDGTGCWAGEEGFPGRECRKTPVGPSGLCRQHVEELIQ